MSAAAAIVRTSLACPLGLRATMAIAAMKAELNHFELDEGLPDATISRLSLLDERATRSERMLALAQYALRDLFAAPPEAPWPVTLPTFLSLPAAEAGDAYDADALALTVAAEVVYGVSDRLSLGAVLLARPAQCSG